MAQAQVGIGTTTPNSKAVLDLQSSGNDKGLLIPRLTQAQRTAIASPPDGLMVFQTDGTTGFWYYFGGAWVNIPNANTAGDNLGNHTATQNLNLGANKLVGNGGTTGLSIGSGGIVTPDANMSFNDKDIKLRGTNGSDAYHGLGWYGSGKTWDGGVTIDGPVLYGNRGGALGTYRATTNVKSTALYWNSSGQVGIGTLSPAATLHVAGTAGTSNVRLESLSGTGTRMVTADDNGNLSTATAPTGESTTAGNGLTLSGTQVQLGGTLSQATTIANGGNSLSISGAGNLGVGTSSPAAPLHVYSTNALTQRLESNSSVGTRLELKNTSSGGGTWTLLSTGASNSEGVGGLLFNDDTGPRMYLDNNGKLQVGLGTNSSSTLLDVFGNTRLRGLSGTGTRVVTADASGNLSTTTTASLADNLGNHTATQNLDLGTSQLVGNGGTTGISISSTGAVTTGSTLTTGGAITAGGNVQLGTNLLVGNGGNSGIYVSSAGNVAIGTTVPNGNKLNVNGNTYVAGTLQATDQAYLTGVRLSGSFSPDATYVGTTGSSISFGHSGVSEDFIGYKSNTFYFKDSPSGSDASDPNVVVGGKVGIGTSGAPTANLEVAGTTSTVKLEGLSGTGTRVVTADASGNLSSVASSTLGDNLGNHTATQNLQLGANQLVGNGGSSGLAISSAGNIGIGTTSPTRRLHSVAASDVSETQNDYLFEDFRGSSSTTQWMVQRAAAGTSTTPTALGDGTTTPVQIGGYMFSPYTSTGYPVYGTGETGMAGYYRGNGSTALTELQFNTTGTTRMVLDPTGQLGIGTTSPTALFDVNGSTRLRGLAGSGTRVVTADASGNLSTTTTASLADNLGNHTATQNLQLGTNKLVGNGGSSGLAISSTGNVGIGTTSPGARLEIQGGAESNGANDPKALAFSYYDGGGYRHFVRSRHHSTVTGAGNDLDFYLNNSTSVTGSSAPGTGNIPVLTMESNNSSPRVGIGTTAPAATLHVAGASSSVLLEGLAGTGTRVVTADASGNLSTTTTASLADNLGNHTATQNLNLGANTLVGNGGSNGLAISNTGNVGIGTSNADSKLEVGGGIAIDGLSTYDGTYTPTANVLRFGNSFSGEGIGSKRTSGGNVNGIDFYTGHNSRMSIDISGKVGIGTSSPQTTFHVAGTAGTSNVRLESLGGTGSRVVVADASGNLSTSASAGSESTTASNGLTLSGTAVQLGGTLSQATTIANGGNNLSITGTGNLGVGTSSPAVRLHVAGTSGTSNVRLESLGGTGTRMVTADASGNLSTSTTPTGESTTAANGLSLSGSQVLLGGTLAQATTISTTNGASNYALTINGAGALSLGTGSGTTSLGNSSATTSVAGSTIGLTGTTNINTSGSAATSIGTGATAGSVTIGRSGGTVTVANLAGSGTRFVTADASGALSTTTAPTGESTTASNGLTLTGTNVTLGGTLSSATTIANGGNNLNITGTGNVGVGTSSPNTKLDVAGGLGVDAGNSFDGTAAGWTNLIRFGSNGSGEGIGSKRTSSGNQNGLDFFTGFNSRLSIASSGNVGIGTGSTAPTAKLDVAGTARIQSLTATGTRMVTADASGNLGNAALPTSESTTAANGLSLSGSQVLLGGTLAQATTISTTNGASNYGLTINGGGALNLGSGTGDVNVGNALGATNVAGASISLNGSTTISGTSVVINGSSTSGLTTVGGGSGAVAISSGTGTTSIGTGSSSGAVTIGRAGGTVQVANLAGSGSRIVTVDALGNLSAQGQKGTAVLGSTSNSTGLASFNITFPTAFSAAPTVICTVRTQTGQTYNDTFAVTTKSINTTGFTVNIQRVDSAALWGQNLLLDWIALP